MNFLVIDPSGNKSEQIAWNAALLADSVYRCESNFAVYSNSDPAIDSELPGPIQTVNPYSENWQIPIGVGKNLSADDFYNLSDNILVKWNKSPEIARCFPGWSSNSEDLNTWGLQYASVSVKLGACPISSSPLITDVVGKYLNELSFWKGHSNNMLLERNHCFHLKWPTFLFNNFEQVSEIKELFHEHYFNFLQSLEYATRDFGDINSNISKETSINELRKKLQHKLDQLVNAINKMKKSKNKLVLRLVDTSSISSGVPSQSLFPDYGLPMGSLIGLYTRGISISETGDKHILKTKEETKIINKICFFLDIGRINKKGQWDFSLVSQNLLNIPETPFDIADLQHKYLWKF